MLSADHPATGHEAEGGDGKSYCTQQGDGPVEPVRLGPDGPWVIPGATIRGLLRHASEIVAHGKLGSANLHHRYGLRDFQHPYYANESAVSDITKVRAGWLHIENSGDRDTWTITPARRWAKVRVEQLVSPHCRSSWFATSCGLPPRHHQEPIDQGVDRFGGDRHIVFAPDDT